ncbi:MAG: hypothetical protein JWR63_2676, partial [Conexibacter sp.]|nr:hypothetical protein [Conexibacter sp.]
MAGGAPHSTANGTVNGHARIDGAPPAGRSDPRADGDVRGPDAGRAS